MPKKYSDVEKQEILTAYQHGQTLANIGGKFGVAPSTIYRWVKDKKECITEENMLPMDIRNLLFQKERLEHILQIIRLSNLLTEVPLRKRLDILESLHERFEQYNVHELCEALSVARGTFYNHIFRRADRTKYQEEQQVLMIQVQQIFNDSKQRFGAEKIRVILSENGIHVGKKRIRQIMQELGLESVRENAKKAYMKRQEYHRRNLVNQEFKTQRPNEIWVSDITYFKLKEHPVFLCVILDLFSRRVVGYRVSRKSSTQLVTFTFRKAYECRGNPTGLTFHSDRGSQYVSESFCTLLRKCDVKQSFSKPGTPRDNAVAETFFATFKKEEAYRREYSSLADFQKSVDEYMRFYNEVRPHQTLAYKTPTRFEELYGKKKTQDI